MAYSASSTDKKVVLSGLAAKVYKKQDLLSAGEFFFKIKIGKVEEKTVIKKGTLTPVWEETLSFDNVSDENAYNVFLFLYEEDLLVNDLVGIGSLSLLSYRNRKTRTILPLVDKKGVEQATVELDALLEDPAAALRVKQAQAALAAAEVALRKKQKDEARAAAAALRKKQEDEAAAAAAALKKKQEEEAAALKKQQDEAAAAALRKKQEEEAAAAAAALKKKQEEEAAAAAAALQKKQQEEEEAAAEAAAAALKKQQEEEAAAVAAAAEAALKKQLAEEAAAAEAAAAAALQKQKDAEKAGAAEQKRLREEAETAAKAAAALKKEQEEAAAAEAIALAQRKQREAAEAKSTILVVRARVNKSFDITGGADPYVVVKVGSVEKRTKVIKSTLNPVWNESFTFPGASPADLQNVSVQLYDEDVGSKADVVGKGTVSVAGVKGRKSVTVVDDKKKETGTVELEVSF